VVFFVRNSFFFLFRALSRKEEAGKSSHTTTMAQSTQSGNPPTQGAFSGKEKEKDVRASNFVAAKGI